MFIFFKSSYMDAIFIFIYFPTCKIFDSSECVTEFDVSEIAFLVRFPKASCTGLCCEMGSYITAKKIIPAWCN